MAGVKLPIEAGARFHRLTVICQVDRPSGTPRGRWYKVKCDCGTVKSLPGHDFTKRRTPTQSCGCQRAEYDNRPAQGPRGDRPPCSVEGCTDLAVGRLLCNTHWKRAQAAGTLVTVPRVRDPDGEARRQTKLRRILAKLARIPSHQVEPDLSHWVDDVSPWASNSWELRLDAPIAYGDGEIESRHEAIPRAQDRSDPETYLATQRFLDLVGEYGILDLDDIETLDEEERLRLVSLLETEGYSPNVMLGSSPLG